jgi:hypothetical protein
MSRADYAHWNEDAEYMWWQEEGRHPEEPPEPDDYDYDEDDEEALRCHICEEPFEDGENVTEVHIEHRGSLWMEPAHTSCVEERNDQGRS